MDGVEVRALLARAGGLTTGHLKSLTDAAGGDITRCLEPSVLSQVALPPAVHDALRKPDHTAVAADLSWVERSGASLIAATDDRFPDALRSCDRGPAVLYVLGDPQALNRPQLAIVGSRMATATGVRSAREFASALTRGGLAVTSGLAVGIDAAAHQGALDAGGVTIAVSGTGLDRVYPTQHIALAERIRRQGALVSRFPPRTPVRRGQFPLRNALMAALSLGTLVVEAAAGSGSLVTASCAMRLGRKVFAIPGCIYSPVAAGCHRLIRDGATLVTDTLQVLTGLGIPVLNEVLVGYPAHRSTPRALDKGYEMLLDAVGFEPATVDILAARTQLPSESVASMLLILELQGRVAALPGGRYGRKP